MLTNVTIEIFVVGLGEFDEKPIIAVILNSGMLQHPKHPPPNIAVLVIVRRLNGRNIRQWLERHCGVGELRGGWECVLESQPIRRVCGVA